MKGKVLSIYLHGFLLRSLSLELLELRWVHAPHSVLHHQGLRGGLPLHSLSLSTAVGCQLLSVLDTRALRWRRGIVSRCRRLRPVPVHIHIGLLALHCLHHLHLLVLLHLLLELLLRAKRREILSALHHLLRLLRCIIQAGGVVLQHSLLQVGRDHAAVASHVQRHLARHHRLLPHELVVLLFPETHHVLSNSQIPVFGTLAPRAVSIYTYLIML